MRRQRRASSSAAAASLLPLPLSDRVTRSPRGGSDAPGPVAVQHLRVSFPCLFLTGLPVPPAAAAMRLGAGGTRVMLPFSKALLRNGKWVNESDV